MAPDIPQIVNVVNLYAVALDAQRYAMFDQVFTASVQVDFGGGVVLSDRATLVSAFQAIHAAFSATQHATSGHVVSFGHNEAKCLSYVHARFRRVIDGTDCLFDSTGWYDDRLVESGEGWRIAHRVSRMVSWTGDIRVMQAMGDAPAEFQLMSLAAEAGKGHIGFFGGSA